MIRQSHNLADGSGVPRLLARRLYRFHIDDRGPMSVLMLLTIMALLGFLALVWNTGEFAVRKHNIQTAADAAAHAAETWNSRTTNLVAATNQLIVENGSAEAILRATGDTVVAIRTRLEGEMARIQRELDRIAQQQDNNNNNPKGPDPNLSLQLDLEQSTLETVLTDYGIQMGLFDDYQTRVTPGLDATTPDQLIQRRADILAYQQNIVQLTPGVIAEQRQAIADFYKCDITLATPTGAEPGPPVKVVDNTNIGGIFVDGVSVPDGDHDVWVVGGEWGRIDCPPLARFFGDRLGNDIGNGRNESQIPMLQAIDDERRNVGQSIRDMLTAPPNADADTQRAYTDVLRQINNMRFGEAFAVRTFHNAVHAWGVAVLRGMGAGSIYELSTYNLYPIPAWARDGVRQDAYNHIYNDVYQKNYNRLFRMKFNELRGAGVKDADARAQAADWARNIATQGATQIAQIASAEWVDREWPYEITPPDNPVPPPPGLKVEDRHRYFTLSAVASSSDQSAPIPMLDKMFNFPKTPMVAAAQAETFTWMEYNGGYGAGDRYDQWMPPRPWRLSTIGGWNWQPKLAFMDALSPTLENNDDFRGRFEESGVKQNDPDAIKYLTQH